MKVHYLEPMYGFSKDHTHIAVPREAEETLTKMVDQLLGTDDLIAIYIPEGTDAVYEPGSLRGRVVGAVSLIEMPSGKSKADYFYDDWDGTRRWPIGWPCRVVFAPPTDRCPLLRSLVEYCFNRSDFKTYVAPLQRGPIPIAGKMASEILKRLSQPPATASAP
jgi:hypothetical protein